MIYFKSTINALQAHITELQVRLASSESERQSLLDRLLAKNRVDPIVEAAPPAPKLPNFQYIAPPGINPLEIQDAMKDVWIQNETNYLMNDCGYEYDRARAQAIANYNDQHGYTN